MQSTPGKKRPRGPGAGRVAFLARLEPIKAAVTAGHPLVTIYSDLGGDDPDKGLGISYSQFARYVTKYVRSTPSNERISSLSAVAVQQAEATARPVHPTPPPTPPKTGVEESRTARKAGSAQPRFQHNPNSTGTDDLI